MTLAAKRLLDPPLALDVRMPPLHPKRSANIQALAAGHGSLFAGEGSTTDGRAAKGRRQSCRTPVPALHTSAQFSCALEARACRMC